MEIIAGVEDVARAEGLSVVLTESGSRHAPDPSWIEGVMRRRPAGIVLVFSDIAPEYRAQLASRGIPFAIIDPAGRSEEHTSELQSLMRISYAVFCLTKKNNIRNDSNQVLMSQS